MPPTGRSAYRAGCFTVLKRCRDRLQKLRGYARWKRIAFDLTLEDIKDLIGKLPDVGGSVSIERIDTSRGFTRDNLILRNHKSRQGEAVRRAPPDEVLQQMLEWLVERQVKLNFKDSTPEISDTQILLLYAEQKGRCAVTAVPLVLDKALHPESLAITRRDPQAPWTAKNTIVVSLALKPFIDKWGLPYLLKVSKRVVKHRERAKKEKEQ